MRWLRRHTGVHEDPDALTIEELRRNGADLSRDLNVDHFLVDFDEDGARAATERLRVEYELVVFAPPGAAPEWVEPFGAQLIDEASPGGWTVQATRPMRVDDDTVAAVRAELTVLAHELGGTYDGWAAEVS
jgi:regulator of RNase E activity RraB